MFKSKSEKLNEKAMELVLKENARLKRENERLRSFLDETKDDRETYKKLIKQLDSLKEKYIQGISEFEIIQEGYKKQLLDIVNERK